MRVAGLDGAAHDLHVVAVLARGLLERVVGAVAKALNPVEPPQRGQAPLRWWGVSSMSARVLSDISMNAPTGLRPGQRV